MKILYPTIRLQHGREKPLLKGHPWLFSRAIAETASDLHAGDVVTAQNSDGMPIGLGFYNPRTDIAFRLVTTDVQSSVDQTFWRHRIRNAFTLRKHVISDDTNAFRLINAEGDFMPGLVVDDYNGVLVMEINTAGMEKFHSDIIGLLIEEVKPLAIYERSDGKSRSKEGLEDRIGLYYGDSIPCPLEITENGLRFQVNVEKGQKSGFFLDQRSNREMARSICRNMNVLNCFSYTGAYSVYCADGGSREVVSVESSREANGLAEINLELNGFSNKSHPVITEDVFRYLRESSALFDMIILDPPAFAKSQKDLHQAARAYKDINRVAMHRIRHNGFLMTFSCSNFLDNVLFEKIVAGAATDAGKNVQILKTLHAGFDHPVILAHPEGKYLKGLLLRISE